MKRILSILLISVLTMMFAGCATTSDEQAIKQLEPLKVSQRKTLAVLPYDFKDYDLTYQGLESGLVDLTINYFFSTQRLVLVERTRLNAIAQELKYSSSALVSTEHALKIGEQAGAGYVFLGAVTSIKPIAHRKTIGVAYINTKGFDVTLTGRIIDIEKGVVVASATAKGVEIKKKKVAFGATTGSIDPDDTLIRNALQKASKILTNDLASQL
ncbi:MAG: hypothetical protein C0603_05500 [Denitrovibrio sp.]|nr:MAG: hypothetical protein C0603_05500 [Denitrovibrio sp.]